MKRTSIIFAFICYVVLFASCTKTYQYDQGFVFGTQYHIIYNNDNNLKDSIEKELTKVNSSLSSFDKNSVISKVNRNEEAILDEMFMKVFNKSMEISNITKGAFDITVAPLVNAYGFGYGKKKEKVNVDSILPFIGYKKISLQDGKIVKENPQIELIASAIAKGFGVDVVAEYLEKKGVKDYMVEIGGEIRLKGKSSKNRKWKIGIDKPVDDVTASNRKLQEIISMDKGAMATSGNYRNFYYKDGKKYSHTIDPRTGYPVEHTILSASVIANNCMEADAYATSFMVLGLEGSKAVIEQNKNLEAYLIYSDKDGKYKVWMSKGIKELIER